MPIRYRPSSKAIDLLETLAQDGDSPTITVIERKLNLSHNKAFRLLATLEDKDLIERDEPTGTFRLGTAHFRWPSIS